MLEFAPRKRRLRDVRLTDYPNTLTMASVSRELDRRLAAGCTDAARELIMILEGVQRWKRGDLPCAYPGEVVSVRLGHRAYAYRVSRQPVVVGDRVRVPGIVGETVGYVTELHSDYTGPVKDILAIEEGVFGVTYSAVHAR